MALSPVKPHNAKQHIASQIRAKPDNRKPHRESREANMKNLVFKDVTAKYEDADGDVQEHTASVAVVTRELAVMEVRNSEGDYVKRPRQVVGRNGEAILLHEGDAVIATERPDVFDVLPGELWNTTGYATGQLVKNVGAAPATVRATEPNDTVSVSNAAVATDLADIKDLLTALAGATISNQQAIASLAQSGTITGGTQVEPKPDDGTGPNLVKSPDDKSNPELGAHADSVADDSQH